MDLSKMGLNILTKHFDKIAKMSPKLLGLLLELLLEQLLLLLYVFFQYVITGGRFAPLCMCMIKIPTLRVIKRIAS